MTTFRADSVQSWPTFISNRHQYHLRYPPDWVVHEERPDMVSLKSPDPGIQLSVTPWQMDKSRMEAIFRGPARANLHLIREFRLQLGSKDASAFEFRDSIAGVRETRVLSPAPDGCYELRWQRPEGSENCKLKAIVDTMLSTFELHSNDS